MFKIGTMKHPEESESHGGHLTGVLLNSTIINVAPLVLCKPARQVITASNYLLDLFMMVSKT